MKKVLVIAPIDSSAYAGCLLLRIANLPGIEVAGVLLRKISLDRIMQEWKRDGRRLLMKIWRKHILRDRISHAGLAYRTAREQLDAMTDCKGGIRKICHTYNWPLFRAADLNSEDSVEFVRCVSPTIAVFAGGGMIRSKLLSTCGDGILNCHMGSLPKYRGMDVVEWPFLEEGRQARPAVTVHFMDNGVDTGPIVKIFEIPRQGCLSIEDIRVSADGLKVSAIVGAIEAHRDDTLNSRLQPIGAGRQYYVMHSMLNKIADARANIYLQPKI